MRALLPPLQAPLGAHARRLLGGGACAGGTCCCVDNFTAGFPLNVSAFDVNFDRSFGNTPPSYWNLRNLTLTAPYLPGSGQQTYVGLPTWCASVSQTLSDGDYPGSMLYAYTHVPPGVVTNAAGDLNQVAWIFNNIFVGATTPPPAANYSWNGATYSGCSSTPVTVSDYQQALWVIVGTNASTSCNTAGLLNTTCGNGLTSTAINPCNVAFILNSAFGAVPKGNNYTVPSSTCGGVSPHIPIVVNPAKSSPPPMPALQPLIVDANLVDWGANCSCVGPPGGATRCADARSFSMRVRQRCLPLTRPPFVLVPSSQQLA